MTVIAKIKDTRDNGTISDAEAIKQKLLAESENRQHFIADSLPQLSWIARPDGYREYFNQRWYEFTGTMLQQVEGDGWSTCVHPEDETRVVKAWKHACATGKLYEIEYRLYYAPSKTYRWVIGRALPYKDESGKIASWYGTSTDIDDHKRTTQFQTFLSNASKELASSLNYTQTLKKVTQLCVPTVADWCFIDLYDEQKGFEQVSIAHVDPKKISLAREFRKHNPLQIDQSTGVSRVLRTGRSEFYPVISDELIKQYITDPERRAFMKSLKLRSIIICPIRISNKVVGGISFVSTDSGRYYNDYDLHMAEELAARISLAMTNSKLYADSQSDLKKRKKLENELLVEQQKLESRVKERTEQLQLTNEGLREEITKRQAVEQELQEKSQNLVELNRSKDEFISIASHQLRTPATGVKQYVGMLLEGFVGDLPAIQRGLLEKAYDSNERQLKIVSDLLKVAQVDGGKVMLRKSDIMLSSFVADIVREQKEILLGRGQTIELIPLECDCKIHIDAASIRMVIENIIDNASKYSAAGSHVEVTVQKKSSYYYVSVRDQGVGINPGDKARLFEKFSRLDNELSTQVGGTGLGLYWARKIVDLHGGKISYTSNKAEGTTFTVKLPKR